MHFSIPDSVEVRGSDSTYLMYNLYVNGNFHCSLRYRQFLGLHEQLRKEVGTGKLPAFPPKKFLSLTSNQLEERRCSLEKYIQTASQNQDVAKSELFMGFLRLAQHETSAEPVTKKSLDVYLPNGHLISNVDVWNNSQTSVLLVTVAEELKLREDFANHFGLYIYRKEPDGTWIVVRKLEEYESPCISIKWLNEDHRIVFRKCAWDLNVADNLLVEDPVGLFLIYVQTVADIENGWIVVPREVLKQLTTFQSKGNKKDYVTTARRLKFYGYVKFPYCRIEGQLMNEITVYVGNKELVVITSRREEIVYKVSRMKCWRITLHHEIGGGIKAEMSFEYLLSKDKLEWVTIVSEQSVVMALCLKEMVADFVAKQHPENPSLIGIRSVKTMFYYIRRDGETVPLNEDIILGKPFSNGNRSTASGSSGNSSPTISTNGHIPSNPDTPTTSLSRNGSSDFPPSIGFTKRRPSSNSLRHQNSIVNSNDNLFLENSAFAGIGDDDL